MYFLGILVVHEAVLEQAWEWIKNSHCIEVYVFTTLMVGFKIYSHYMEVCTIWAHIKWGFTVLFYPSSRSLKTGVDKNLNRLFVLIHRNCPINRLSQLVAAFLAL